MLVQFVSLIAASLMVMGAARAESGGVVVNGQMRYWMTSDAKVSARQAAAFCKSQGLQLVTVNEGLKILEAEQTSSGNELLGDRDDQTFWTSDRGFTIDGITIIPTALYVPYPGYFHRVVKVYQYHEMPTAVYFDVVNQPFTWGFRHRALCISN